MRNELLFGSFADVAKHYLQLAKDTKENTGVPTGQFERSKIPRYQRLAILAELLSRSEIINGLHRLSLDRILEEFEQQALMEPAIMTIQADLRTVGLHMGRKYECYFDKDDKEMVIYDRGENI